MRCCIECIPSGVWGKYPVKHSFGGACQAGLRLRLSQGYCRCLSGNHYIREDTLNL